MHPSPTPRDMIEAYVDRAWIACHKASEVADRASMHGAAFDLQAIRDELGRVQRSMLDRHYKQMNLPDD